MKLGSPLCHQDVKMTRLGAGGGGNGAVPQKRKVIRN